MGSESGDTLAESNGRVGHRADDSYFPIGCLKKVLGADAGNNRD